MRVGDEKDTDETDTIGASTLRVEHLRFPKINDKVQIEFNFLGKDSVPWQKLWRYPVLTQKRFTRICCSL